MPQLKRELSTFDLTMIAIGSTIGSGIFLTPSIVAQNLPSPVWILGVWVVGGIMALCGALTFAELGGMFPSAGGMYVYLSEAYGKPIGFLFGWAYFLVVNTGGIAALSLAFATYLGFFIPLGATGSQAVAIGGLIFLTALNVYGVKPGSIFSDVFTMLKLAGIAGLIIVGFTLGSSHTTDFSAPLAELPMGLGSALAAAMVGVLWSYGGWQHASFTAGEAKNPTRSVPLAMIIGASVVTVVYLLANLAYLFLLSTPEVASSTRLASDAISKVLGPAGGSMIAFAIFISTFGSVGIFTLTAPRIYFAMANDGVFFARVAEVHPRFHTPAFAIIVQSAWAIVLILFWRTFDQLISYVVFTDWIFFGLTAASVFIFRKRSPDLPRPYRTFGYPVTPAIFVGISLWFVIKTLFEQPAQALAGLAFLALGIVVYYQWKNQPKPTL